MLKVKKIGMELGLPTELVEKIPIDGLCGKTDEDNLGFSYETLDAWIREGIKPSTEVFNKIIDILKCIFKTLVYNIKININIVF